MCPHFEHKVSKKLLEAKILNIFKHYIGQKSERDRFFCFLSFKMHGIKLSQSLAIPPGVPIIPPSCMVN